MNNKSELLIELCRTALKEMSPHDGWQKIILVGQRGEGFASMAGYSFDATGRHKAISPRGETIRLMRGLAQTMAEESATGRPWVSCLLRIRRDGDVGAEFEYADPTRWAVTPKNLEQRIAEFAAMPV